jgi:chromosome segregation ATPase
MDTLEQACARLEAAVERLGQAVEAGPRSRLRARIAALEGELAATASERQSLREELGRLGAERDRLNTLVSETQKRYAAAKVVSDAVAARLNQAIADVRSLVSG